ncbi:glycosyltransferase [Chitinophaga sp. XS-30]|uniref:glycosyltransferase family 2 protein n=1 Tax=Chitinophaga sp. XS-30 TaxID=2604421 RepID=UPI0011DDAC18|nr:glycosyltransferase [Chitinophaga sp. XS-30]QEH42098.1 glycosyltransferase [Chitinophaga sp. XS-30]
MPASPRISVLLPVYNGAAFLAATIRSVLEQTEGDFELLILNDGSTDDSEAITLSFADSRIRYFHQENRGLIATLNRGIAAARGRYIARIDSDDICLPERFARQADWLDAHPDAAVAGCFVTFIDETGRETGTWPDDRRYVSEEEIKGVLPYRNVIAHPGIMAVSAVLREYGYDPRQQHMEDYDLWLRLLADGKRIGKVPETLLLYRVHQASVTAQHIKKVNLFFRQFHCKRRFLAGRLAKGKFSAFDARVVLGMMKDLLTGMGKWVKGKSIKDK